jgi:hypothetical protein
LTTLVPSAKLGLKDGLHWLDRLTSGVGVIDSDIWEQITLRPLARRGLLTALDDPLRRALMYGYSLLII